MASVSGLLFSSLLFALGAFSVPANHSCKSLKSSFGDHVLFPGSSQYNASVSSYFFLEQRMGPTCIVAPTSAEEVAKIVKLLASCKNVEVAIRSGGHSPNQFFSNTNNGITVDLRGLNSIALASDGKTVSVGTGALWGDVYDKLNPLGKTVVGARVYDVGVGGFLSGGGISFFSPRDGFGCDNVQNMQVVLANGRIVNANATSNPLLFRALKGGQNNFGIITRFDLAVKETARFWGGAIVSLGEADAAQLDAFTAFKSGKFDPLLEIEQTFVYYGSQKSFFSSNNLFYLTDSANTSALDQFTNIQPQASSTLRLSNASDFAKEVEAGQPMNQYSVYATVTFPIGPTILKQIYDLWKDTTNSLASAQPDIISALTYQSIPPPPGPTKPQNSFPFSGPSQNHNLVLMLLSLYSPEEKDYALINREAREFIRSVEALLANSGGASPYKYLNYAASWQDPISGYGPETVTTMKAVAARYDPEGFFQKVVTGGFKLQH